MVILPRVSRPLLLALALAFVLGIPASASATVTGTGVGASVLLESDGDGDVITLTCEGGMAPQGSLTQVPCAAVEAVIVFAGAGDDTVKLENVGTTAFSALKRTEIHTGEGEDTVFGSQVEDTVVADEADSVAGGPGDDFIEGTDGGSGDEGNDVFFEATGSVDGGLGDDRFENPGPFAKSNGGSGSDSYVRDFPAAEPFSVHFGVEDDGLRINSGPFKFAWSSIERVALFLTDVGTQSVDASGFSGSIEVDGRGGPDTIVGSPGEDLITGGAGDDDLTGNGGFDWVRGGEGIDQLRLRDGAVDRGLCGDGVDNAVADAADSLEGCEDIDLPPIIDSFPPPPPPPAPETTISRGPKKAVKGAMAVFKFVSSQTASTFKCRVDKGPLKLCTSPFKLKTNNLAVGRHVFAVVATSAAGASDLTPATLNFNVAPKPKPHKRGRS